MKLRALIHPILMIAVLSVAFSVYAGWYSHVEKKSAEAVSLAGQVEVARQQSLRARESQQELENVALDEATIRAHFVDTANVVTFLESLQATGAQFGSRVEVVSVAADAVAPHAKLTLSLRITGLFDSVERTLGAIEYQPYDTAVQSLTLDTVGGEGIPEWTAAITMFVGTNEPIIVATTTAATTRP